MKLLLYTALTIFLFPTFILAQSTLTLEDIFQEEKYTEKSLNHFKWHPNGQQFMRLEGRQVLLFDADSGQQMKVLFDGPDNIQVADFEMDHKGNKILIQANAEKIYRHSKQADFLVYDLGNQTITNVLDEGKQRYARFNHDGNKVAFIFENDLYYRDLENSALVRITNDGLQNEVINGAADWVYEEEFGLTRAFAWSPDDRYLAYLRFDEGNVPEFTMINYQGEVYPSQVRWKYPKVGQAVAKVTAHVFDLKKGTKSMVNLPASDFPYLPRIGWSPDGQIYLYRMNRHQSQLEFWLADPQSGQSRKIMTEKDRAYVKLHDNLAFLPQKKGFLWTSERDGWNHIYHYDLRGRMVGQVTSGEWEVSKVLGCDPAGELVYFQSTEKSPLERHIYSIGLTGKGKTILNNKEGWQNAQFSPDFGQILIEHSTINTPPSYGVYTSEGNLRYWLEENRTVSAMQQINRTLDVEFWSFETADQVSLNGWMIKPPGFNKNKQYPVLMQVYGGPGSQRVANRWNPMRDYWWMQMMAQNGYVVACVDNRGTGGRGAKFQKQTYLKLGQYETRDQIEAARYLAEQSYVDRTRIGIYGKSYGGYMAALCLLKGGEVFAAGVVLAPVTHWQWYDCVYTERYMRTVEENSAGYYEGAPVNYADQLVDPMLLVHGLGDDNVHFQHTAELAAELISANKPFDSQFYPNINHSLRGGNAGIHLYTKMTDFIDVHLRQSSLSSRENSPTLQMRTFPRPPNKFDLKPRIKKIQDKEKLKRN